MAELIRFNVGLRNGKSELYKYIEKNKDELKGNLGAEVARLAELGLFFSKMSEIPSGFSNSDLRIPAQDVIKEDIQEKPVADDQKVKDVSDTKEFHNALAASLFQ